MHAFVLCILLGAYAHFTTISMYVQGVSGYELPSPQLSSALSARGSLKNNLLIRAARGERVEKTPVNYYYGYALLSGPVHL